MNLNAADPITSAGNQGIDIGIVTHANLQLVYLLWRAWPST
jgi:hypothetical protein